MRALRGVNLGGWLLLERWITPDVFAGSDARDHYSFMQTPGAAEWLAHHISTFITEDDFIWLSKHGIEAVRIPIGYWILDGDEPYQPCIDALDWAVEMGGKYDIRILISLHGAPGSQNGRDHSGRVGRASWFRDRRYRLQTLRLLERLSARYVDRLSVWGIELLNEPKFGLLHLRLKRFSRRAYARICRVARPDMYVVFHDAFTPRLMSNLLWPHRRNPVAMDVHWYHFAWLLHTIAPVDMYYRIALPLRRWLNTQLRPAQPLIIGEWSAVLSTHALRHYPTSQHEAMMDEHARRQLLAYDGALAWFYWTYRTQDPGVWNFRSMVDEGRIKLH